jgi:hypothetical protein
VKTKQKKERSSFICHLTFQRSDEETGWTETFLALSIFQHRKDQAKPHEKFALVEYAYSKDTSIRYTCHWYFDEKSLRSAFKKGLTKCLKKKRVLESVMQDEDIFLNTCPNPFTSPFENHFGHYSTIRMKGYNLPWCKKVHGGLVCGKLISIK